MLSEIPRKSIVNTAESRQIFPLCENTLRHVVEGDGRYPRAMTPSDDKLKKSMDDYRLFFIHHVRDIPREISVMEKITFRNNSWYKSFHVYNEQGTDSYFLLMFE